MRSPVAVWACALIFGWGFVAELPAQAPATPTGQTPEPRPELGLVQAWSAHVQTDPDRGEVNHLVLHVSRKRYFTVYRVKNQGREVDFSEQAYDSAAGSTLLAGARQRAENLALELKERGGSPEIVELKVAQATLYAQSNSGSIQAIDAHTGQTRWTAQIGRPNFPTVPPAASDEIVAAVSGTSLTLLKTDTGEAIYQRPTAGVPAGPLAIDDRFLYIPTVSSSLEAYDLKDRLQATPWRFSSNGMIAGAPLPINGRLQWTSVSGAYYSVDAEHSRVLFSAELEAPIAGGPTPLDPDKMVVTTADGLVHAFDRRTGGIVWRQSVGDDVDVPAVADSAVYVVTRRSGIYAFQGESGDQLWHIDGVRQLLSISPTRVYALAEGGRLVAINREQGVVEASTRTHKIDLAMTNVYTDRIFLGNRRGKLICLREADLPWPHVHLPNIGPPNSSATPARSTPPAPPKPGEGSGSGAAGDEESASPFGDEPPAAGDARAGDAAAADEAAPAEPSADEADPFGPGADSDGGTGGDAGASGDAGAGGDSGAGSDEDPFGQ